MTNLALKTMTLEKEKTFGEISVFKFVYQSNFSQSSNFLRLQEYQKLRRYRDDFMKTGWDKHLTHSDPINFEGLNLWVQSDVLPGRKESVISANAYNGYLRGTDAHSYLLPWTQVRAENFYDADRIARGIGIDIKELGPSDIVVRIFPGYPAAIADLKKAMLFFRLTTKSSTT